MNSCVVPNAKQSPANSPSAWADSPNSARSPVAMMAVMVRNAWLSAKPVISTSSTPQAVRAECRAGRGRGKGGVCQAGCSGALVVGLSGAA